MLFHKLPISLILLCYSTIVLANTEIINFDASEQVDINLPIANQWITLSPTNHEKQWNIIPALFGTSLKAVCSAPEDLISRNPSCPHEIWIKLDLEAEEWKQYSKFTLRVSWPAFSPADFALDILNPTAIAVRFTGSSLDEPSLTRIKYARIRIVDTGVFAHTYPSQEILPVPFIVTLEPLYFKLIPASVVPLLWILLPLLSVLGFAVPRVNAYLQEVAAAAKKDLAGKSE